MVTGRLAEKNDYFYVIINYKDESGKRKERWIKTGLRTKGNKRKAEDILKHYRECFNVKTGKLESEEEIDSSSQTSIREDILFGDYLNQWLERIKSTLELTSYAGYKTNVNSIIAPYFNERNIHLSELTGEIIDEFYKYQMDRGVSANTVIHYHANIRKCLDQAFRDDLIPCNYAAKAHRPKKSEFISEYYNRDELLDLFNVVKNKKIEFAVLMASYYGLRRSEIIGLKWSCIDFKNKMFIIRHTVTECRIDGKNYVVAKDRGKSKKSVRTLPLVPPIEKVLLNMKELEDAHKKFFGKNYNYKDDEYIYKDPNGERVKLDFITQHFTKCVIKPNPQLKRIRFHDLRHSCATLLRSEGVPLEDIQKWLGHSEITTTEKYYAKFEYKAHLRSANKITNAFNI